MDCPANFDSHPTTLSPRLSPHDSRQVTPPPRASSPPHLRADATRAQKVRNAAAAVAALDPAGLIDLGGELAPEIVSHLLARLLARPTGASTLANELPPAACQRLADGVGWPCHVERVRWSWVCDVMTHLMNGTSFVHADTTSHSTPRGPLAGELSTCASDSPGAPGPRRSDIRERRTQHTLLSKQVK
jgi:hypothetical protein